MRDRGGSPPLCNRAFEPAPRLVRVAAAATAAIASGGAAARRRLRAGPDEREVRRGRDHGLRPVVHLKIEQRARVRHAHRRPARASGLSVPALAVGAERGRARRLGRARGGREPACARGRRNRRPRRRWTLRRRSRHCATVGARALRRLRAAGGRAEGLLRRRGLAPLGHHARRLEEASSQVGRQRAARAREGGDRSGKHAQISGCRVDRGTRMRELRREPLPA
ncbi:hypothetical protein T492DRAFT_1034618 [Pavlovales sp. CCMP2436]|nr:hypothetical protein T492DRAFT_1034618 [Pavlovales sp. CCMP2436]